MESKVQALEMKYVYSDIVKRVTMRGRIINGKVQEELGIKSMLKFFKEN